MDKIITPLSEFIESNKTRGTCIKFVLGKYTSEFGFDKKLFNDCNYAKIKNMLESNKAWEDIGEEIYEYIDEYPVKIIDTMIIKYLSGPYDILVTAETVDKYDINDPDNTETNVYTYTRKHHNFVLKNYTYKTGDNIQKFELYLTTTDICSKYLAHSSLLKLTDVTGICDKPEYDIFEILQKNN